MARVLIFLIQSYRFLVSPFLPSACRFHPSCSAYAVEAIRKHSVGPGLWLVLRRLLKCHPFHPGGFDPIPVRTGEGTENPLTPAG